MERLNNKLWTLPVLMLAAGFLSRQSTYLLYRLFLVRSQGEDGVWTVEIPGWLDAAQYAVNLLFLIGVILLTRRLCSRRTVVRSAVILVGYGFVVLALEQLSQRVDGLTWMFPLVVSLGYLPQEIWVQLGSRLSGVIGIWLYAILLQFAPLLLIPFAKKDLKGRDTDESRTEMQHHPQDDAQ